ncbi:acyl-CoA esterase, partial [Yersinia pestis]
MTQEQQLSGGELSLPNGELVLRTLAMPADTNANGDIFGGWLMSQMDIGGAIQAKEIAQ